MESKEETLVSMGFTSEQAKQALAIKPQIEDAIQWLIVHGTEAKKEPLLSAPPPFQPPTSSFQPPNFSFHVPAPLLPSSRLQQGTVTSKREGYGFISRVLGPNIFFHFSQVRGAEVSVGDEVTFEEVYNEKRGVHNAHNVQLLRPSQNPSPSIPGPSPETRLSQKPTRRLGTVHSVNPDQGYGFIILDHPKQPIFFWTKDVRERKESKELKIGDIVQFAIVKDEPVVNIRAFEIDIIKLEPLSDHHFVLRERFTAEENRETEFKSLAKVSKKIDQYLSSICEKYINAFLNSNGGRIYFGVEDDGKVTGLYLDRYMRDLIRRSLDSVMNGHTPSVENNLYNVHFQEVFERILDGGVLMRDLYVVVVTVEKGTHSAIYQTKTGVAYIRRDGSVVPMTAEMIQRRAIQDDQQKRKTSEEQLAEQVLRKVLQEIDPLRKLKEQNKHVAFKTSDIEQLMAMGFKRHFILDCYYQLQTEGIEDPKISVVLDRLSQLGDSDSVSIVVPTPTTTTTTSSGSSIMSSSNSFDLTSQSPLKKKSKTVAGSPAELPCEFCSKPFSASKLEIHQSSCRNLQQ